MIFLFLHGCATKQATDYPAGPTHVSRGHDEVDRSLSSAELKALKTTGQIDRDVPSAEMGDVAAQYRHFLRKGRKTMCAFSKRSEPYLAYARQVFRERNMPEELANLAIVESGYKTDARSKAGAAGAWQFMPQTGLNYGLSQDWWQDERLDPYRATEAAADYLQKLYNDFGDWPTAIAAYNSGEGKMSRAMQGTGGKDFFEAKAKNHVLNEDLQLREETKQYVPRFMAISKIMRNLPELGFEPIDPEKSEPVRRLTAYPGMDLKAFSQACDLSWADFYKHNQHHKRTITCTDRETYIYVPERVRQKATEYLCNSKTASYAGWQPQKVAANGDSLEKISKRTNIPLMRLQAANPGMNRLKSGQIILVPNLASLALKPPRARGGGNATFAEKNKKNKALAASEVKKNEGISHIIQAKDTLFSIAQKYGTDVPTIIAQNGIDNPSRLKVGQSLAIPSKKARRKSADRLPEAPVKAGHKGQIGKRKEKVVYTVQSKDNLWNIARKHNISVDDLKRWNKVDEKNLRAGTRLIVAQE